MRFRPCIDIHNGKVKQIVGGTLRDDGAEAQENFVSAQDGGSYGALYYGLFTEDGFSYNEAGESDDHDTDGTV